MDRREAEKLLLGLRAEQVADQKRIDARQMMIDGIRALFPDIEQAAESLERPKTQDAIRQIMQEAPGKWFTVNLMVHELERRGWMPESENPSGLVRTALARLADAEPKIGKGKGEKTGSVTYSYRPTDSRVLHPVQKAMLTGETRNGTEVDQLADMFSIVDQEVGLSQ
jgi:hypothetical protein